eukprot:NODE_53_length_1819_cov_930.328814_g44_i0.p1 GENE.NODE_53_length_1819_cov_930.328814_g44_i0~~NODE_53_length_1819_cov_930.328814_g44_i0.p1  ORF type:complete len:528 (+),score=95.91 NODE_53_length_1819_cov_930.328814_g44_i0:32-1585(+)
MGDTLMQKSIPTIDNVDASQNRCVERIFFNYYSVWAYKLRFFICGFFIILAGLCTYVTTLVESPDDIEFGMPDGYKIGEGMNLMMDYFPSAGVTAMTKVTLAWGIDLNDPIDRGDYDRNNEEERGTTILSTAFDPTSVASQQAILDILDSAHQPGYGYLSENNPDPVWISFRKHCIDEHLKYPNATHPWCHDPTSVRSCTTDPSMMVERLKEFTQEIKAMYYLRNVGFLVRNGAEHIVWAKVDMTIDMPGNIYAEGVDKYVEAWDGWMAEQNDKSGHDSVQVLHCSYRWVISKAIVAMKAAAFVGIGTSLALAFAVLTFSTGNVVVALYSVISISGVVLCVFSFMVAIGWKLDIMEAICLTILVGMSVDYVVHYANAYTANDYPLRKDRTRFALFSMGISVSSGAVSTLCSSFVLFFCKISFFWKFGTFMFINIFLSYLWANGFFITLCMILGPEYVQGKLSACIQCAKNTCCPSAPTDEQSMSMDQSQCSDAGGLGPKPGAGGAADQPRYPSPQTT